MSSGQVNGHHSQKLASLSGAVDEEQKKQMSSRLQELSKQAALSSKLVALASSAKVRPGDAQLLEMNLEKLKEVSQEAEEVLLWAVGWQHRIIEIGVSYCFLLHFPFSGD